MSSATTVVPVLPLRDSVLFPTVMMPLVAGRATSIAAVEAAVATEDKTLVLASQLDASAEQPRLADFFRIGTRAVIKKMERAGDAVHLIVQGLDRVELLTAEQETPFVRARVRPVPEPTDEGTEIEALRREVLELGSRVVALISPQAQIALAQAVSGLKDPLRIAYLLASMLSLDAPKQQALLGASSRGEALRLLHGHLTHELQVLEIRQDIQSQAESEMGREQRRYLLRQQLRAIQQELGEGNPEEGDVSELRGRLEQADLPANALEEARRALARLERLTAASPEYQLTRTHLELLLELPWQKETEDHLDLRVAREVLDADHYGLDDVKDRIVEQLAVRKLNPEARAPILCFVGPPGVGKTSLGKSIARALGRQFERMSLGGLHDEAELRGHRRTYIGAMPGRIIQAIRRAGVLNPLLMLDEIDKLGHGFHGDPAAALLEVLDPAQNFEFRDNYLEVPFDLSRVFFITTANTLDTIPQPLLDRMEIIRLSGYTDEEKARIAERYLFPRQLADSGLNPTQLALAPGILEKVIRRYTREAGVRQLERVLGRLCRKVAARVAQGSTDTVTLDEAHLTELLGPERFFEEEARSDLPPGVATGLAWTQVGGEVMYVEAVSLPGRAELMLTGQLGEVMKESARAAQSFLRSRAAELGVDPHAMDAGVHIHVPAGATPKDGPSAGVAMAAAMASLYSGQAVRSDTAMTGEITLSGLVLPVGGIKEKVLAAHRARIKRVILPRRNQHDLRELTEKVRSEIEFVFADRVLDAVAAAIPALAEQRVTGAAR